MTSLLDAIGALIIGGLLLLTMINAVFNVHARAVDIEQQIVLAEVSENIVRIISEYLSLAGAGAGGQMLNNTGKNRLMFSASDSTYTGMQKQYDIIQGPAIYKKGYPLEVYINSNKVLGPFYLTDSLRITYFNEANQIINLTNNLIPVENLDDIRYIRMEMEFFYDAFAPDSLAGPDRKDPKNRVVLWHYFFNLYL
ncbi:MAG: hypothetical protein JXB60_01940 [Candidatus Cloacimonetes bacterium]|nr:hypothetical protein [Candidatus Cloacimonadota bacterium]